MMTWITVTKPCRQSIRVIEPRDQTDKITYSAESINLCKSGVNESTRNATKRLSFVYSDVNLLTLPKSIKNNERKIRVNPRLPFYYEPSLTVSGLLSKYLPSKVAPIRVLRSRLPLQIAKNSFGHKYFPMIIFWHCFLKE